MPFEVTIPGVDQDGRPIAPARMYVATQERAEEVASGAPGRTWREIAEDDMPDAAREHMRRAREG